LRIAAGLLSEYQVKQPFSLWLQDIFRQHKHFGSKDRRFYKDAFYAYWKLGNFGKSFSTEQRLLAGLLRIYPDDQNLKELVPELFSELTSSAGFNEIERFADQEWNPYGAFDSQISPNVKTPVLNHWFGKQAPVWLKFNSRFKTELWVFLSQKGITFEEFGANSLKVSSGNLEDAVLLGWCRIQDLGSQESLNTEILSRASLVWDTCCGAGGKSLLLSDLNPDATLYISDTRSQMVHNALQRFSIEGKPLPFSGIADLSVPVGKVIFDDNIQISKPVFDTLICDVPCSGSGTWRRSPEMLTAFMIKELGYYQQRQRNIVKNALPFLKQGGKLIYLTCSVFTEENENNRLFFVDELGLKMNSENYCGGYEKDADFIYRAVLEK
jgi:16S rRNA (cytosine967-C5)-methyltransferase